ncbi:MAG: hypothetical protein GY801_39075 [bacterium]|nr:hypothetical protein [bacterium]
MRKRQLKKKFKKWCKELAEIDPKAFGHILDPKEVEERQMIKEEFFDKGLCAWDTSIKNWIEYGFCTHAYDLGF